MVKEYDLNVLNKVLVVLAMDILVHGTPGRNAEFTIEYTNPFRSQLRHFKYHLIMQSSLKTKQVLKHSGKVKRE